MSIKFKAIILALLIAISSGSIYFYLDKQVVEIGWVYGKVLDSNDSTTINLNVSGEEYHFINKNIPNKKELSSLSGEFIKVQYQKKFFDKLPKSTFYLISWEKI